MKVTGFESRMCQSLHIAGGSWQGWVASNYGTPHLNSAEQP